jgi:hypothetical protein
MMDQRAVRASIDNQEIHLWAMGMHSITFVSDDPGDSAAVVISRCADHAVAARIAETILGEALVRVDTLRFDEPRDIPAWLSKSGAQPRLPHPRRQRREREQALAA